MGGVSELEDLKPLVIAALIVVLVEEVEGNQALRIRQNGVGRELERVLLIHQAEALLQRLIIDQVAHAHGQLVPRRDQQIGRLDALAVPLGVALELWRHLLRDEAAHDLLVQLLLFCLHSRRHLGIAVILRGARVVAPR